jgi:aminoglycoside 3-N-acetyltransferase
VAEHALDDPFGEDSPLARLYELGAQVLLLGVGFDSNTSLHLSERRAFGDTMPKVETGSPILVKGHREWVRYDESDVDSSDFERLGKAFLKESTSISTAKVGTGSALLMPQRELIDFGVSWLRQNRDAFGRPLGE